MLMLVKLFGIMMVGFGVAFLVRQDLIKKYLNFWIAKKRIYLGAILSIEMGIIMLRAAGQCEISWFVALLGIWAIIKGMLLFVMGPKKLTAKMSWWASRPAKTLRLIAVIPLAVGALLIYAA